MGKKERKYSKKTWRVIIKPVETNIPLKLL